MEISNSMQNLAGIVEIVKNAQGGSDALSKLLTQGNVIEAVVQGNKDGKLQLNVDGVILEAIVQSDTELSGNVYLKVGRDDMTGKTVLKIVDQAEFLASQAKSAGTDQLALIEKTVLPADGYAASQVKSPSIVLEFENTSSSPVLLENMIRNNDNAEIKIMAESNGRVFVQDGKQTKVFIPELEQAGLKFPAEYSINSLSFKESDSGKISVQLNLTSALKNTADVSAANNNMEDIADKTAIKTQVEVSGNFDKQIIAKIFEGVGVTKNETQVEQSIKFFNNIGIKSPGAQQFKALAAIESLGLKPGKELFLVAFDAILQKTETLGENMFKLMQPASANEGKFIIADENKNSSVNPGFLLLDNQAIEMTDNPAKLAKDISNFLESMRIAGSEKHPVPSEIKNFIKELNLDAGQLDPNEAALAQKSLLNVLHEFTKEMSVLPRMLTAAANMQVSAHGFEPDTGMNYMLMSFPLGNNKEYMPNMVKITYKGKDEKKKKIDWKNCKVSLRMRTSLLGMICIDMSFNAARLNCQLLAENQETEMLIGTTIDKLSDSLEKSGFNLGSLKVGHLKKEKTDEYTERDERQSRVRHAGIIDLKV